MQSIFKRYEMKYLLTNDEYNLLLSVMKNYMAIDKYGKVLISNVYFDTPNYKIIRASLEKPLYKEKFRVRAYGNNFETVFLELKKKFDGVVYKRRIVTSYSSAYSFLVDREKKLLESQIVKEINYFLDTNESIFPSVYLSYEREAFYGLIDDDFRMTFDHNIKARDFEVFNFNIKKGFYVLSPKYIILEVKTNKGLPIWFLVFLNENNIFKKSFSKYGSAYNKLINEKEDLKYV